MKLTGHFFLKSQFQRYDAHPEQAHPTQPIADNTPFSYWASLPPEFQSDIDDVINISNSKGSTAMLCFFKGSKYLKYDIIKAQPVGQPAEISQGWPGLINTGFDKGIDAASEWVVWGEAASTPDASIIMFFKGDQYISCTPEGKLIEQKPISELCKDFTNGTNKKYSADVDCVLLWCNEMAYFFKGGNYIRYNLKKGRIDDTETYIAHYWHDVSFPKIQAAVLFDETLLASQPTGTDPGNTTPRPIPSLPKGQFTVTLVNNENWLRTATLNIDGKDQTMDVAAHKAVSKAFTTTTGQVTIALYDSKHGAMRLPLNLTLETLGATGHSMTFGAEKPSDEALPAYMDVFVHIDWTTDVKN